MKKIYSLFGVWIGICLIILFCDNLFLEKKTVEVFSEKKLALNVETSIPDAKFRSCLESLVKTGGDYTLDGKTYSGLTEESLEAIKYVRCDSKGITNIKGSEYLKNVEKFNINNNQVKEIKFTSSTTPKLKALYLSSNKYTSFEVDDTIASQLITLDVSNNNLNNKVVDGYINRFKKLTSFSVANNNLLDILDVSGLNLLYFYANDNDLKDINFGNNSLIKELNLYNNELIDINISKLTVLDKLDISSNQLSDINLGNNKKLTILNLENNEISNINLDNNTELTTLYLNENKLTNIDLSKNIKLKTIKLDNNKIANVTVNSNNLELLSLLKVGVSNLTINMTDISKLHTLDITNNNLSNNTIQNLINRFTGIVNLGVSYNNLSTLNVSGLLKLQYLNVEHNNLSSIDLSKNTNLEELVANYNKLTSVNLPDDSSATADKTNLQILNLSVNSLKNVDLSKSVRLKEFYMTSNSKLTNLDFSKNPNLEALAISLNDSLELPDLSNNTGLKFLTVSNEMSDKIDYSKLTKLEQISTEYYLEVPVYGKSISGDNILKLVPDNIDFTDYKFQKGFIDNIILPSNINTFNNNGINYYELKLVSDNAINSNISNFNGKQNFTGWYNILYVQLTSDKYLIDENKNKIDVGGDSDEEIKQNLKVTNATIKISDAKLSLLYNDTVVKEFTLLRTTNPKTGGILITLILSLAIIAGVISIFAYRKMKLNNI